MARECGAKKKGGSKKGTRYTCEVCGLIITVNNVCGCGEKCDIICCGEEMKRKK